MITYFKPPSDFSLDRLHALNEQGLSLSVEATHVAKKVWFDSFDWRMFQENLEFVQSGETFTCRTIDHDGAALTMRCRKAHIFVEDLPNDPQWAPIRKALWPRALTPVLSVTEKQEKIRITNTDDKTVVRLFWSQFKGDDGQVDYRLNVRGMRGYQKEEGKLRDALIQAGCTPMDDEPLKKILARGGRIPGAYTSKVKVALDPDMRADEAARLIYKQLLEVININLAGTREDLDSEFLHDYRVAVRRTRSALSQMRGVMDPEITERAKTDFSYLGKLSNVMRDIDVYQLARDDYHAMVPQEHKEGLDTFFNYLRRKRVGERKKMLAEMESPRFVEILAWWGRTLEGTLATEGKATNGHKPVHGVACTFIKKRLKRVLRDGWAIHGETPDEELHDLRIQCKKLRYLLEFYSSVFNRGEIKQLIAELKKLQENLGDFNDLCVQRDTLNHYRERVLQRKADNTEAATAVGFLMGVLYSKQLVVRREFHEAFETFASGENQQLCAHLFGK